MFLGGGEGETIIFIPGDNGFREGINVKDKLVGINRSDISQIACIDRGQPYCHKSGWTLRISYRLVVVRSSGDVTECPPPSSHTFDDAPCPGFLSG